MMEKRNCFVFGIGFLILSYVLKEYNYFMNSLISLGLGLMFLACGILKPKNKDLVKALDDLKILANAKKRK